LSNDVVTFSLL